jgi:conjugative transfer signal peptidase TraF
VAAPQENRTVTRFAQFAMTTAAITVVSGAAVLHPAPRLIWNASASVPIGLYAVHPARPLHVNDLVVVMPPEPLVSFLDTRRYLPIGVPLLKHIAAIPGQTVCRIARTIMVDGIIAGAALDRDSRGRPLPVWQGCRLLAQGEVFLMNEQSRDSLDGRYFGPLPAAAIVGKAEPIWIAKRQ